MLNYNLIMSARAEELLHIRAQFVQAVRRRKSNKHQTQSRQISCFRISLVWTDATFGVSDVLTDLHKNQDGYDKTKTMHRREVEDDIIYMSEDEYIYGANDDLYQPERAAEEAQARRQHRIYLQCYQARQEEWAARRREEGYVEPPEVDLSDEAWPPRMEDNVVLCPYTPCVPIVGMAINLTNYIYQAGARILASLRQALCPSCLHPGPI